MQVDPERTDPGDSPRVSARKALGVLAVIVLCSWALLGLLVVGGLLVGDLVVRLVDAIGG